MAVFRRTRHGVLAMIVGVAALIGTTAALAAYGGSATITHFTGNITSCTSLGYPSKGTIADQGASGTYNHDSNGDATPLSVQVTNLGGNPMTFDWQANLPVAAVVVKIGSGGTIYTYSPAALSDTGLESLDSNGDPKDTISHLLFCPPATTAVKVRSFAADRSANGVRLGWKTAVETGTLGFNLYRQMGTTKVKLNSKLIRHTGSLSGARYSYLDRRAPQGHAVRYLLQEVRISGVRAWLGNASTSA